MYSGFDQTSIAHPSDIPVSNAVDNDYIQMETIHPLPRNRLIVQQQTFGLTRIELTNEPTPCPSTTSKHTSVNTLEQ
ncbi:MAG: hypothetical protein QM786_15190 [Breznakibacter sp.]